VYQLNARVTNKQIENQADTTSKSQAITQQSDEVKLYEVEMMRRTWLSNLGFPHNVRFYISRSRSSRMYLDVR